MEMEMRPLMAIKIKWQWICFSVIQTVEDEVSYGGEPWMFWPSSEVKVNLSHKIYVNILAVEGSIVRDLDRY